MSNEMAQMMLGGGLVQVMRSAEEVGLLGALEIPGTAAQLATRLGLDARAVGLTLGVLEAVGHVERDGDVYRIPEMMRKGLEELPGLTGFLRTGRVPEYLDRPEHRGAYYADGVAMLGEAMRASARQLAAELGAARRIVDVGAGSAVWGLSMVEASGGEVVAVDDEAVLHNAQATARSLGLEDRLTLRAGDYFDIVVPNADRVVLANVLHLETPDDAARLVRHHARSLAPGGEVVVVDVFGGAGFEARLFEAVYQLHLGMRTRRGRAHAAEQVASWCADAGLPEQRMVPLRQVGMGALVCRATAAP